MGNDVAEAVVRELSPSAIKVHRLMCADLMKLVGRISEIFPEIEVARPRCSSGIHALCLLNGAIEKAKLLLQYCSESSKLYLAIKGDVIKSRCEKSSNLLEQSLSQIQNMVPIALAVEISHVIDDLRNATFIIDSSEEETGKVLRALLHQNMPLSASIENHELEALQFAASRLHITSQKSLLIEKRSIKKLLHKISDSDSKKKIILKCLLYLLNKYGISMLGEQTEKNHFIQQEESFSSSTLSNSSRMNSNVPVEDESQTTMLSRDIPALEFQCMHDPVEIASGKTFERTWIQKWFDEGHGTCPNIKKKLAHLSLTPNTAMKDLKSKWCSEHGFIISDRCVERDSVHSWENSNGSSMNDIRFSMDFNNVSLGLSDNSYISDLSPDKVPDIFSLVSIQPTYSATDDRSLRFLSKLNLLHPESQQKVVEDVKKYLQYNPQAFHFVNRENFVEPLIRFLKDARDLHNSKCLKAGSQLLLVYVNRSRNETPCLLEDTFNLSVSLLGSDITEEALSIMVVLSSHKFRRSIECIPKLVPLLYDETLAKHCIVILKNLCDSEDARVSIAETNGCIGSIIELLENGSREDQEHAVAVLFSLSSQRVQYCQLIIEKGVFSALCHISINGNDRGKSGAIELLRILRDFKHVDAHESFGPVLEDSRDSGNHFKGNKLGFKASAFIARKMSLLAKASYRKSHSLT